HTACHAGRPHGVPYRSILIAEHLDRVLIVTSKLHPSNVISVVLTCSRPSLVSGGYYPLAARFDFVVHRVGSQVRSIGPHDRAEFDPYLSEVGWIAQPFEQRPLYGGTFDERAQMDITGGPV